MIDEFVWSAVLYVMILYPQRRMNTNLQRESSMCTQRVSWKKIIESDDGYEQFANFLEKEFSCENILFITEYVQLKNAMNECDVLKEHMDALELTYSLQLP